MHTQNSGDRRITDVKAIHFIKWVTTFIFFFSGACFKYPATKSMPVWSGDNICQYADLLRPYTR